jgi:hypothetical protein
MSALHPPLLDLFRAIANQKTLQNKDYRAALNSPKAHVKPVSADRETERG